MVGTRAGVRQAGGDERRRRVAGVLVLAAVFSLPALAYARTGLTADAAAPGSGPGARPAGRARLVEPAPWQGFRAGAAVGVVAAVGRAPACTVVWDDGATATVPVRRGVCASSRVVHRPGVYAVSVAAPGEVAGAAAPVVVYDPHAGSARGSGVTDGIRYSVEAGYVPWRRTPAPAGSGTFDGPDGLSARVAAVDWVLVTPERTTAVRGTAVATDGTAYRFVVHGRADGELRLAEWRRLALTRAR